MRATLLVFMALAVAVCVGASDKAKVKIAVYYESLCPDSKRFITQQLAPAWRSLRGDIKVKLVPYGKSTHDKVNNEWQFICHHGPDECYGNKVQACILKDRALADTEKMEMVICLMGQANPDKSLDTCLTSLNKQSESTKLKKCAASNQGSSLLATAGDKTAAVQKPLTFVPTIVIDEKFDQNIHDRALLDLKKVVCEMSTNKPAACN